MSEDSQSAGCEGSNEDSIFNKRPEMDPETKNLVKETVKMLDEIAYNRKRFWID